MRRAPEVSLGKRLSARTYDKVFQIAETHGEGISAKAYTLCDLHGNRCGFEFVQPVALDRLIPIELLPLAHPDIDDRSRLVVVEGSDERRATVVAQAMDGRVYLKFDDSEGDSVCVDLSTLNYRWIS